jgi:hypothetical protein
MNSAASASDTRNKLNEEDMKRREELIRERDAAEKKDWDDNQAKERPRKERRTYDYEDDVGSTAFPPDCEHDIVGTLINLLMGIPTAERKIVLLDLMSKYDAYGAGSEAGDADTPPPRIPVPVATWLASIHPALSQYAKGMHDFGYDDTFFIEGAPRLELEEAFNKCNMVQAHRRMILDAKNLLREVDCLLIPQAVPCIPAPVAPSPTPARAESLKRKPLYISCTADEEEVMRAVVKFVRISRRKDEK